MVETKQDIGLAVLTSSAVFGSWSAWNSSLFTAATFVDTEEKYRHAKLAMDLGFVTAIATGAAVYFIYGDKGKIAAASAVITGAALYGTYYCKLRANPKLTGYMMGGNKNVQLQGIYGWEPLSDQDIQYIIDMVENNNGTYIVSEP